MAEEVPGRHRISMPSWCGTHHPVEGFRVLGFRVLGFQGFRASV